MPRPYASGVVPASADDVWKVVRDFNGLPAWLPAVTASELDEGGSGAEVGAVRRLTLDNGGTVVERLVELHDGERRCTYEILESSFPVRRYVSTFRVAPITASGETFVEWWSEYDADGADEANLTQTFADGIYGAGIAALRKHFDG
ncbi:SRPBCC family protein [Pseudonocardia zijingensis]|uniref:SRPBCC family protein n=1 Tax=Pseudonocardia zijingensis TaxID=153376 RepID=A0ABP4B0X7_9PSEU